MMAGVMMEAVIAAVGMMVGVMMEAETLAGAMMVVEIVAEVMMIEVVMPEVVMTVEAIPVVTLLSCLKENFAVTGYPPFNGEFPTTITAQYVPEKPHRSFKRWWPCCALPCFCGEKGRWILKRRRKGDVVGL